jgi:Flp pilus assembly protein TadD
MLELAQFEIDNSDLNGAVSLARHAVELKPTNPDAHHILGRALLAAGQTRESAQELESAERLGPQSSAVHFHLAAAYRQLGRTENAQREMAAYVSIKKREGDLDRAGGQDAEHPLGPSQ